MRVGTNGVFGVAVAVAVAVEVLVGSKRKVRGLVALAVSIDRLFGWVKRSVGRSVGSGGPFPPPLRFVAAARFKTHADADADADSGREPA